MRLPAGGVAPVTQANRVKAAPCAPVGYQSDSAGAGQIAHLGVIPFETPLTEKAVIAIACFDLA